MALVVKNLSANAGDVGETGVIPGSEKSPGKGMAAHCSVLAWKSRGQRSLAGYSPWGHKELNQTEATWHVFHIINVLTEYKYRCQDITIGWVWEIEMYFLLHGIQQLTKGEQNKWEQYFCLFRICSWRAYFSLGLPHVKMQTIHEKLQSG